MIKLPQETTLGSLIMYDEHMLRSELLGSDLTYGVRPKRGISIITGRNVIEKELPVFHYPYKIDDKTIIDLRPYVKNTEKFELEEIINLRLSFGIPLLSGILVDNNEIDMFKQFYIKVIQILVGGRLKNALNLSISDSLVLNNILAVYATNMVTDYDRIDACIGVAQMNTIGEKLHENDLKTYINGVNMDSIAKVCEVLSGIEDCSKTLRSVTQEVVNDAVGGVVFGTHRLPLLIGLESPYTLIPIVYTYLNNPLYKKTGIVFSVGTFKSALKVDMFNNQMLNLMREYKVDKLF